MKKITLSLIAAMLILITSCEKQDLKPSKPDAKDQLQDCKGCGGTWDKDNPEGE